jgi:hypothetical protein
MTASSAVPGSVTTTANAPADTASHQSSNGRCPRCERMRHENRCPGVYGEIVHLGS